MTMIINWLLEPLRYGFMQRGFTAAVLVGVVCAVVGTYVVLRGMAFFGDALAHTILPGVAIGYLVSGGAREPLFWWALGTAVVASLGIGAITRQARIKEDTAIGIIFAGMFALGIAIISTVHSYAVDLSHFLFGDVLGVTPGSLRWTAIFGGLVLLLVVAFYKEFMTISFDPILAVTLRLPVSLLNNLLLVLIAITVATAMQTVGVALMVAMLVTPAAAASLLSRRLPWMMMISATDRCPLQRYRTLYFVLCRDQLGSSDRAHRHPRLRAGLPVCPPHRSAVEEKSRLIRRTGSPGLAILLLLCACTKLAHPACHPNQARKYQSEQQPLRRCRRSCLRLPCLGLPAAPFKIRPFPVYKILPGWFQRKHTGQAMHCKAYWITPATGSPWMKRSAIRTIPE